MTSRPTNLPDGDSRKAVEDIINHILAHKPNLSRDTLLKLIRDRVEELEGLIEEDAAALLIAKELGVPLPQHISTSLRGEGLRLKDLVPGLRNLRLIVRVLKVASWRLADGRAITKITVADDTSCVDCVAWGETAERVAEELRPGDCILIAGASVDRYRGRLQVRIGEGARIERVDSEALPPLEVLCKLYQVDVFRFHIHEIVRSEGGSVLYGIADGEPACILVPSGFETPTLQRGDVILVQDPKRLSGAIPRYKLTRGSRLFVSGKSPVARTEFKVANADDDADAYTLGMQGLYVAVMPSKLHGGFFLLLAGRKKTRSILTYDEKVAGSLRGVRPGSSVRVTGVYPTNRGLRLNPFYNLEIFGDADLDQSSFSEDLASAGGPVKVKATILSAFFKLRILSNGEPLLCAALTLDDGLGRARALSSYPPHLETLLRLTWDEVLEQASLGLLPKLIEYVESELVGAEAYIEGYLCVDRTLSVIEIRLA